MFEMETRRLFGGAIEISLPRRFLDVSAFRQVPDHQEVFTSDGDGDELSFIFEIVELQSDISNDAIATHFWRDLVEENDAQRHRILSVTPIERGALALTTNVAESYATVVVGEQDIVKGSDPVQTVQVHLGIVRLFSVRSELLLSMNRPSTGDAEDISPLFASIIQSAVVKDWRLFG